MSVLCECVVILGCLRWAWKRCTYIGAYDSATWPPATADEFSIVPRLCRLIIAAYEDDLLHPKYTPAGGYNINPNWIVKRVTYQQTNGRSPPYLIYADHQHHEIVLAIRGLNLVNHHDYKLLLDNRLGKQMFDGGYVHHGLLKSAIWLLNEESETLRELWVGTGSGYRMVFTGHSLGSGVAALLTVIVVNHGDRLGGVPRSKVRCYALAPARCMSLNLAVRYADVICSVVLQDDFLPRTPTPLEDIFQSIFWDTFIPEDRKLNDPRRLYAPGRIYHIVERKFCRCGRYPPEVRTAIPVEGRFEHIVLSLNATSDHGIIWIEREAEKALQRMRESEYETTTSAPEVQKMERLQTIEKEHKDALDRAVSLNIPHATRSPEEVPLTSDEVGSSSGNKEPEGSTNESKDAKKPTSQPAGGKTNWDELVEMLFDTNESGKLQLKRDVATLKATT